jgi:DNA-binding response OmpR family regulator
MILLVEDHAEMRRYLGSELRAAGFSVVEVSSGEDALVWLGAGVGKDPLVPFPDLVISDVWLSDQSGLEILERLRLLGERTPVILITAFPDALLSERARRLGAACLIEKPFLVGELLGAANRVLDPADQARS